MGRQNQHFLFHHRCVESNTTRVKCYQNLAPPSAGGCPNSVWTCQLVDHPLHVNLKRTLLARQAGSAGFHAGYIEEKLSATQSTPSNSSQQSTNQADGEVLCRFVAISLFRPLYVRLLILVMLRHLRPQPMPRPDLDGYSMANTESSISHEILMSMADLTSSPWPLPRYHIRRPFSLPPGGRKCQRHGQRREWRIPLFGTEWLLQTSVWTDTIPAVPATASRRPRNDDGGAYPRPAGRRG